MTIYLSMIKNWVSHILFLEKGAYRIPGSAGKGDYNMNMNYNYLTTIFILATKMQESPGRHRLQ